MSDIMNIEILADGTIKIDSGTIAPQNHMSAEAFLRNVASVSGSVQRRKHKQGIVGAVVHKAQHVFGGHHHH